MSATLGCSIKLAEPTAVQLAQLIAWLVDGVQPGNQKLGPSWGKTWTHGAGLRATFRFAGVENGLQLLLLARGSSVRHEMSATVLLFAHDFGSPSELTNFLVNSLYRDEVLRAASHLKAGRHLALQIEARFISISTDNLADSVRFADAHRDLIKTTCSL
ncbi:hypothetical protein HYQ46_002798 [Verticillium longisporum]|nr:hypothetical protein HYQ46_002798 [Verticillium longisporum]